MRNIPSTQAVRCPNCCEAVHVQVLSRDEADPGEECDHCGYEFSQHEIERMIERAIEDALYD